jgi:hypothetical protein
VGIGGPDYDEMVVALGQEDADDLLSGAEMRVIILEQGQLQPGHFRGRKPN